VTDDVLLNKVAVIERCLKRLREEFRGDPSRLENQTVEDAIVLNLQRACEASIDLAMHVVAGQRMGIPQSSGEAFEMLEREGVIEANLAQGLRRMVGFRNVAVHAYQAIDRAILLSILKDRLGGFGALCRALLER
jgi:uncharacterized protein YutE (UPF0331/DUF86 family)